MTPEEELEAEIQRLLIADLLHKIMQDYKESLRIKNEENE